MRACDLLVLVLGALWALLRRRPAVARSRATRAAIYVLLGVVYDFGSDRWSERD